MERQKNVTWTLNMTLQEFHCKNGPNLGASEGLVILIEWLKPVKSHERAKNIFGDHTSLGLNATLPAGDPGYVASL